MMEVDRHPEEHVGTKISGIGLSCAEILAKAGALFYTCVLARSHEMAFWHFLFFPDSSKTGKTKTTRVLSNRCEWPGG